VATIVLLAGVSAIGETIAQRRDKRSGAPPPRASQPAAHRSLLQIARATFREFSDDGGPLISAGVAFFTLLALFPGLAAFVALYGLVSDVDDARRQFDLLARVLPGDAAKFLGDEMVRLAKARGGGLSAGFAIGLIASLWSANGAAGAVMTGLNLAHETHETRPWWRLKLTAFAFTLGLLTVAIVGVAATAAGSAVAAALAPQFHAVVGVVQWPLLVVLAAVGVAVLYRFGSARPVTDRLFSWGGLFATVGWIVVSLGFSLYVGHFAHYERTYGALGSVVGLMMWLWLSSMILMFGAELDCELTRGHAAGTGDSLGRSTAKVQRGGRHARSHSA
jgi:membrane protein